MRTFSLIWSGIGCFATVAITVLGGVILAGGNNVLTAEAGVGILWVLCSVRGSSTFPDSDFYEKCFYAPDFLFVPAGVSSWGDSYPCQYRLNFRTSFSVNIILKDGCGYEFCFYNIPYSFVYDNTRFGYTFIDDKTLNLRFVGEVRNNEYNLSDVFHFTVSKEPNTITSHISVDE
jgi:hypothetical protein